MTHPRTCPLLVGMISLLREEVKRPENDDLEEAVEELAERVVEAHSSEADTHLRGFSLLNELFTQVLPCVDYMKTKSDTRSSLGELEKATQRAESAFIPIVFSLDGLRDTLDRVQALSDKKELDHISMELRGEDLTGFNGDKMKAFTDVTTVCRKVATNLQKSLRGTQVSWHVTGKLAGSVFCRSFPLESTISLVNTLLSTCKENAQPQWTP